LQLQEANSFERESEADVSTESHNRTALRVRPQPRSTQQISTAPSEENDVTLQSVIIRIEHGITRCNVEETRNEDDDDEFRQEEAMSRSRIPDTPDHSMDTDRTILQATFSFGNISRRPGEHQGLRGSSRLMVRLTHGTIYQFLYLKLVNERLY